MNTDHEPDATDDSILIVEPSMSQRALLCSYLTQLGYCALEAESGEDAQLQIEERMPEAVLIASELPGIG